MTPPTDKDIVASIADFTRQCRVAALPCAWRIIVARLRDAYGRRLVDRALRQYERGLRQENRSLRRQVRRAREDHNRGRGRRKES
jgi:hypothetical protein